jgi:hypothetical protein
MARQIARLKPDLISETQNALRERIAYPPPKAKPDSITKSEFVRALSPQIRELLDMGDSMAAVAALIKKASGVSISATTIWRNTRPNSDAWPTPSISLSPSVTGPGRLSLSDRIVEQRSVPDFGSNVGETHEPSAVALPFGMTEDQARAAIWDRIQKSRQESGNALMDELHKKPA